MRLLGAAALALLLSLGASGCEVYKLAAGTYGGIRGVIVEENGEPMNGALLEAKNGDWYRVGVFAGLMDADRADAGADDLVWRDFGDGNGRVLARKIPSFYGLWYGTALQATGQPGEYFLREGEFVIDRVLAGQMTVKVEAWNDILDTQVPGPRKSYNRTQSVKVEVPIQVVPDQWNTMRIVVPHPTVSPLTSPPPG